MINPFFPFFPAEGGMFTNRAREQALAEGVEPDPGLDDRG